MTSTRESRRTVFRRIAKRTYADWPAYQSTPVYDRASLAGLESDVRIVADTRFNHDNHNATEEFVCSLPLAYFSFDVHDEYVGTTRYAMDTLFRVFVLQEIYRWTHETALIKYLNHRPELCGQLGLETVPDQSTLWRSWQQRFTDGLRETVQKAANTILIKAQNADITVPREPERSLPPRGDDGDGSDPAIELFSTKPRRSQSTSVVSSFQRSR